RLRGRWPWWAGRGWGCRVRRGSRRRSGGGRGPAWRWPCCRGRRGAASRWRRGCSCGDLHGVLGVVAEGVLDVCLGDAEAFGCGGSAESAEPDQFAGVLGDDLAAGEPVHGLEVRVV